MYCILVFFCFSLINHISPALSLWPKPVCLNCNKPGRSVMSPWKQSPPTTPRVHQPSSRLPHPHPALYLQAPGGERRLGDRGEAEAVNWRLRSRASEARGFAGAGARMSELRESRSDLWSTDVIMPLQPPKNLQQEALQLLLISVSTNYTKQIVSRRVSIIFNSWQWIKVILFQAKF